MEPAGGAVRRQLSEFTKGGAKEDKGRTRKGRLGLGGQTHRGLTLKGSGQPFIRQGAKIDWAGT